MGDRKGGLFRGIKEGVDIEGEEIQEELGG